MKLKIFLFSRLIDEPNADQKWKSFVYKAAFFSQYITTFLSAIALVHAIMQTWSKRTFDYQFIVAVLWYFAPFMLYFLMLYIAPAVFTFVLGLLLFRLFK